MKNIFLKINNKINSQKSGFILLLAIILTAIILAVTAGVSNVTFRELTFSTSAKASNEAFYAADVGVECALYYDFKPASTPGGAVYPVFGNDAAAGHTFCAGDDVSLDNGTGEPNDPWEFVVLSLGETHEACAIVSVVRDDSNPTLPVTRITSRGFNLGGDNANCVSTSINRVERRIEVDVVPQQ